VFATERRTEKLGIAVGLPPVGIPGRTIDNTLHGKSFRTREADVEMPERRNLSRPGWTGLHYDNAASQPMAVMGYGAPR
jgi:hypothetical protein